jgi:hypothetical protein
LDEFNPHPGEEEKEGLRMGSILRKGQNIVSFACLLDEMRTELRELRREKKDRQNFEMH